jgi:hypothetical protein
MRKIMFLIALPALMTAISCSKGPDASKKEAIAGAKEIGVIMEQDSSIRIHPLIYSARIAVLATGEQVEVLEKSKEKAPVAGKLNYWYKIRLRDGIVGWVYGANLKVFAEGSDRSVESFAKELRAEESVNAMKALKGKWWSVTETQAFTDNIISLKDDGTYASMKKGSTTPTEGEYKVDTLGSKITFSKGSTVGETIDYIIRGDIYILEGSIDGKRVSLKKISSDPEFKQDMTEAADASVKPAAEPKAKAKNEEKKEKKKP